jgi:PspAA-like protein
LKRQGTTNARKSKQLKKSSSIRRQGERFKKIGKARDNSSISQTKINEKVKSPRLKQKQLIVRVMDLGQFNLNIKNAKEINQLDNSLVDIVKRYNLLKREFGKKLTKMLSLVVKQGKSLDQKQIVKSDIILPPSDISIDEASKLFIGEGIVHKSILH